jgi:hypothetical protein
MGVRNGIALSLIAVLAVSFSVQQGTAQDSRTTESPAPFSLVVNATGPGITAVCTQGCAWEEVSATYPGGMYRITEQGIQPASHPHLPDHGARDRVVSLASGC